jgi:hypothetical protein
MYGLTWKVLLILSLSFTTLAPVMNAQEIMDNFKEKLKKSLMVPDTQSSREMQQSQPQKLFLKEYSRKEVLKVSPLTKLPTKYDRIIIPLKQEEMQIYMYIIPSNAPPINMLPVGSVAYVMEGNQRYIRSIAGKFVVPSEDSFDPTYGRAERRRKRTDRLVRSYINDNR